MINRYKNIEMERENITYHGSHLSSNQLVSDNDANIVQQIHYDPWGNVVLEYNQNWHQDIIPNFTYQAKIADIESGLIYFESRYYAPKRGVFTRRDDLFESYYWCSPYASMGNNWVSRIDPTGMSWDDVVVKQENGKTIYSATITGVVYNNSSSNIDMNAFKDAATQQIKDVFNFSGDNFEVKVDVKLRVANSISDIKEKDHVIQIVNDLGKDEKGNNIKGNGDVNGLNIKIGSKYANDIVSGKDDRTISHELGHTGGLIHPKYNYWIGALGEFSRDNLMSQSDIIGKWGTNPSDARVLTQQQINHIWNNGNLNSGSALGTRPTISSSFPFLGTKKVLK